MNSYLVELSHPKPNWISELGEELLMGVLSIAGFIFVLLGIVVAGIGIIFGISIGLLN